MRLNRVVVASSNSTLTLSFTDISNGYYIKDIQGLGPVPAQFSTSDFAGLDGSQYQSSRRGARNLVFRIGYEPDYVSSTVTDLRWGLYSFFQTGASISLSFVMEDNTQVLIPGRVETAEPAIFTSDPEFTVSILCFSPDFRSLLPLGTVGETGNTSYTVNYTGTSPVGFEMNIAAGRALSNLVITNQAGGTTQTLTITGAIPTTAINISTVDRDKFVTASGGTNLLGMVSPQSDWIKLHPGQNLIKVAHQPSGTGRVWAMAYFTMYGGI